MTRRFTDRLRDKFREWGWGGSEAKLEQASCEDDEASVLADCMVCGAEKSIIVPPTQEPGPDGKVAQRLASTFCLRCGATCTMDVSGGHELRLPEVEWQNRCPRCHRTGDLELGEIFQVFTGPTLFGDKRPPKPGVRWAWCPGCETNVFVLPMDIVTQVAESEAKRARRDGKLHRREVPPAVVGRAGRFVQSFGYSPF